MSREIRDEDIRDLLGGVVDSEPPMNIDRAAVLSAGKRSLRRRRLAAASGVAVGVVAVALGATAIAGPTALFGGPDLGPAGPGPVPTQTETTKPPQPTLTSTTRTTQTTISSSGKIALVAGDPASVAIAGRFTDAFYLRSPLPGWAQLSPSNMPFALFQGGLRLTTDVRDSAGLGSLTVEIHKKAGPVGGPTCQNLKTVTNCSIVDFGNGTRGTYTEATNGPARSRTMSLVKADGFEITATSTNSSFKAGGVQTRPEPTLSRGQLESVALSPPYPYPYW